MLFIGDGPDDFLSDWSILLKHEDTFHGDHDLFNCLVLVIHDLIDEFYLELIEKILH